jgi:hypothetical protein
VRRGRSITFESGPAANRHVLTKQYIFNSGVAPGSPQVWRRSWVASWIAAIRQTRAEPVFDTSSKADDRAARPMAAQARGNPPGRRYGGGGSRRFDPRSF